MESMVGPLIIGNSHIGPNSTEVHRRTLEYTQEGLSTEYLRSLA